MKKLLAILSIILISGCSTSNTSVSTSTKRTWLDIQKQQTLEFTTILSEYKIVLKDIVAERQKIENLKKQKLDFDYYN